MKSFIAPIMAAILLSATSAGPAFAHGTVDQAFEGTSGAITTLNGTKQLGQTFKPTADSLIGVDLFLSYVGASVRVSVHAGNPTGTELAAVTQAVTTNGWNHFDFQSSVPLTPGNTYSIRLQSLSLNPSWGWRQNNVGGATYADGDAWICQPTCGTVIFDFMFRTYTGANDSDGDGVLDSDDFCSETTIPEGVPTQMLLANRWALMDDDGTFDTVVRGRGRGPRPDGYSIEDTAGCSCEQILAEQGLELDDGQTMFGCSIGVMDNWVELVSP